MGSTNFLGKTKSGYRGGKSGSSAGSDKDYNGKLRRPKIRRPTKLNEYGLKRIPDYTEMAYKEAVSKLKYFLSGSYMPSVRSYGGSPSIKNLDDPESDVTKKYTGSYTLAEYTPRPRLAAKYASLYADSLNNRQPAPRLSAVPAAPAPSCDVTGGTSPDVVNFIQKQEEYIEQLERESQYCRDELNNLLGKVKEVISENEHLHEAQKNKLISNMFTSYNAGSETDELDDFGDSTGLDSDNKISPSKYRKSRSTKLEGPNIVFESRIAELEAQLTQSKIDLKKIQDENNENKRKLASGLVDSTCLDGFKRQIDNLQRDKSSLESQISKLKLNLESREGDEKYRRGDGVELQLREERNALEVEIRRLKEDLTKERNKVRELAGEGARRAVAERSAAELRYNTHFDELQRDLAAQYDVVAKLQLELERQRREENELKRALSMKSSVGDELRMELKNKTASLQADLAQAHAEKASLEEELASARLAMERHQRQAKHEANRLNSEIQSLRQRLDRADADLVHSRRENLRLSDQIATLEKELNLKDLTPFSPEKKKEKELSTMLESMENKHAKTVADLETMIHSQNSLMEKLTGECRSLTDKLDDANRRHKQELATLQRQVENLGRSMQPTQHAASTYQAPTPHSPIASRLSDAKPNTRPDHTRTNPARHTPTGNNITDLGTRDLDSNGTNQPTELTEDPIDKPKEDFDNTVQEVSETKDDITEKAIENPVDDYNPQYTDPNYDNYQPNYDKEGVPYEENQVESEYQNQEYDQNYEQTEQYPNYEQGAEQDPNVEGKQYENYEQYPQEYSTDPNVQYSTNEYPNYGTDGTYQEQAYDNTQYEGYEQQYDQQQTTETQPTTETENSETVESKRSNSPNDKVTVQS